MKFAVCNCFVDVFDFLGMLRKKSFNPLLLVQQNGCSDEEATLTDDCMTVKRSRFIPTLDGRKKPALLSLEQQFPGLCQQIG